MSEPLKKTGKQSFLRKLGPGLITGAADDDPSGIASYSQAGAQFGYAMLWSVFFTTPLMIGIQIVSARIGRVTGHGLAANIREHYPKWLLYSVISLLLFSKTSPREITYCSKATRARSARCSLVMSVIPALLWS